MQHVWTNIHMYTYVYTCTHNLFTTFAESSYKICETLRHLDILLTYTEKRRTN